MEGFGSQWNRKRWPQLGRCEVGGERRGRGSWQGGQVTHPRAHWSSEVVPECALLQPWRRVEFWGKWRVRFCQDWRLAK